MKICDISLCVPPSPDSDKNGKEEKPFTPAETNQGFRSTPLADAFNRAVEQRNYRKMEEDHGY
jgi:hypothetical protein